MAQVKTIANRHNTADEEHIEVLTVISVVSMRLARMLTLLSVRSQSEEGGKHHEQKY